MDNEDFEYQPLRHELKEIRLVILLPGEFESAIKCVLSTKCLSETPGSHLEYDALSYEWGPVDSKKHEIELDGKPFTIRENLWHALKQMRAMPSGWKVLWIDAICINQADIRERNHQVAAMSEIFLDAVRVRVWLGPAGDQSQEVFDMLANKYPPGYVQRPGAKVPVWIKHDYMERPERLRDPLYKMLHERTFWKRIWVVQEFVLAQDIILHCGSATIFGDKFEYALLNEQHWNYGEESEVQNSRVVARHVIVNSPALRLVQHRRDMRHGRAPLLTLFHSYIASESTNARDRIYAILHLANDVLRGDILVNYEKSVEEVMYDVAIFYHSKYGGRSAHYVEAMQCIDKMLGGGKGRWREMFGGRPTVEELQARADTYRTARITAQEAKGPVSQARSTPLDQRLSNEENTKFEQPHSKEFDRIIILGRADTRRTPLTKMIISEQKRKRKAQLHQNLLSLGIGYSKTTSNIITAVNSHLTIRSSNELAAQSNRALFNDEVPQEIERRSS